MQRCSKCSVLKPFADFYRDGARRRGQCKPCILELRRQRYAVDGETLKARVYQWQAANPQKVAETRRRRTLAPGYADANRKGHLRRYGLTPDEFAAIFDRQGSRCGICLSGHRGNDPTPRCSSSRECRACNDPRV